MVDPCENSFRMKTKLSKNSNGIDYLPTFLRQQAGPEDVSVIGDVAPTGGGGAATGVFSAAPQEVLETISDGKESDGGGSGSMRSGSRSGGASSGGGSGGGGTVAGSSVLSSSHHGGPGSPFPMLDASMNVSKSVTVSDR